MRSNPVAPPSILQDLRRAAAAQTPFSQRVLMAIAMRLAAVVTLIVASCGGNKATEPTRTTLAELPPVATTSTAATTTATATTSTTSTTTEAPAVTVRSPGTYEGAEFEIRIRFESQIAEITSSELSSVALDVLNKSDGWRQSGFSFTADELSELRVVLAEGPVVDVLCLPLETYGTVSCQNGPVVALNADRWRFGGDDWDSTVEAYRVYLLNHEVGHLIGLRHPTERCPTPSRVSALMEPQTNNMQGCVGNGIPLEWEIEWAKRRPIVVGPDPDWDGPRPEWPTDD